MSKNKKVKKNYNSKPVAQNLPITKSNIKKSVFVTLKEHNKYLESSPNCEIDYDNIQNIVGIESLFHDKNNEASIKSAQNDVSSLLNEVKNLIDNTPESHVSNYLDFCNQIKNQNLAALFLLNAYDSFLRVCSIDPTSGSGMVTSLSSVFSKLEQALSCNDRIFLDRLSRIILHTIKALEIILKRPHLNLIREHEMLHVSRLKEVDLKTVAWLSRMDGA